MHAFDFVVTLLSFVYALAITHILATVGDIIRAGKRVRFSWLNAAWMLSWLMAIVSWWIAMWGLREQKTWTMPAIGLLFVAACSLYLSARLVCAHIPAEGQVDLRVFHRQEGWKYATSSAALIVLSILMTYSYGATAEGWLAENIVNWPFLAASVAAAVFPNRWVQTVAVSVILATWVWFFATLQSALT